MHPEFQQSDELYFHTTQYIYILSIYFWMQKILFDNGENVECCRPPDHINVYLNYHTGVHNDETVCYRKHVILHSSHIIHDVSHTTKEIS